MLKYYYNKENISLSASLILEISPDIWVFLWGILS